MFGKLVKHEFRATGRIIPFVFLVTIFMGLITITGILLNIDALIGVSFFFLIITLIAEVVVTYGLLIWRFYKTMCGNEAYLSFTLPVKPRLLYFSKMLVSFVWVILSMLVLMLGLSLIVLVIIKGKDTSIAGIIEGIKVMTDFLGFSDHKGIAILFIIVVTVFSILGGLTSIFFAVTLGSTSRFHKFGIGGPILVYLVEYISLQMIGMLAFGLIPLALEVTVRLDEGLSYRLVSRNMIEWILEETKRSATGAAASEVGLIGIGTYIVLPIILAVLFMATTRIVEKHMSIR